MNLVSQIAARLCKDCCRTSKLFDIFLEPVYQYLHWFVELTVMVDEIVQQVVDRYFFSCFRFIGFFPIVSPLIHRVLRHDVRKLLI